MIDGVRFVLNDDKLIAGYVDGVSFEILFSDIQPYWCYANVDEFEEGFINIYDNRLLFTMLTASGQGGVVVLWNAETEKVEHVSCGSYCVAADMDDEKIYTLLVVYNYTTALNLQVWETPIGILDGFHEGDVCATGLEVPPYDSSVDPSLRKIKHGFEIEIGGRTAYIMTVDLT